MQQIPFHHSIFSTDIKLQQQFVEDALACDQPETAQQHLFKLAELIANASQIFPEKDIKPLRNKQQILASRIDKMSEQYDVTVMKALPPPGIGNAGNDCAFIASGLFTSAFVSSPKEPFQMIYEAQRDETNVFSEFGKKMRNWTECQIKGEMALEWCVAHSKENSPQVDALIPLQCILEKNGVQYDFIEEITREGISYISEDEKTGRIRIQKEPLITLDLSKGQRTFPALFEEFFTDVASDSGVSKKLKFTQTPQDLVIAAWRSGFRGGQHKIDDPIKQVPGSILLKKEFLLPDEKAHYELLGCMIHHGKTIENGHYTYLRKVGNTWIHVDDNRVEVIDDPTSLVSRAYVYHYQRTPAPEYSPIENAPSSPFWEWTAWGVQKIAGGIYQGISQSFKAIEGALSEKAFDDADDVIIR